MENDKRNVQMLLLEQFLLATMQNIFNRMCVVTYLNACNGIKILPYYRNGQNILHQSPPHKKKLAIYSHIFNAIQFFISYIPLGNSYFIVFCSSHSVIVHLSSELEIVLALSSIHCVSLFCLLRYFFGLFVRACVLSLIYAFIAPHFQAIQPIHFMVYTEMYCIYFICRCDGWRIRNHISMDTRHRLMSMHELAAINIQRSDFHVTISSWQGNRLSSHFTVTVPVTLTPLYFPSSQRRARGFSSHITHRKPIQISLRNCTLPSSHYIRFTTLEIRYSDM